MRKGGFSFTLGLPEKQLYKPIEGLVRAMEREGYLLSGNIITAFTLVFYSMLVRCLV